MSLFRRIFGKSNDDGQPARDKNATVEIKSVPNADDEQPADIPDNPSETVEDEYDDIDPTTKPVAIAPLPADRNIGEGVTRPLTSDQHAMSFNTEALTESGENLSYGQSSHVGRVRSNNQDSMLSILITGRSAEEHPNFGLFVVADGMGGHHDGEKASAIVTRVLASEVMSNIYMPILTDSADAMPITEAMISSIQNANLQVIKNVPEGGTTATAVAIIGDLAHVVHVGDSRAYLITQDGLDQITRDHSLVQRLIELDQLTREEADRHPQKNVLYRAIGQNDQLEVDTLTRRLPGNSRLLLCSDGLWSLVEEDEIFEITMNTPDPQAAADKLIGLANSRGGTDNVTAVIVKISGN